MDCNKVAENNVKEYVDKISELEFVINKQKSLCGKARRCLGSCVPVCRGRMAGHLRTDRNYPSRWPQISWMQNTLRYIYPCCSRRRVVLCWNSCIFVESWRYRLAYFPDGCRLHYRLRCCNACVFGMENNAIKSQKKRRCAGCPYQGDGAIFFRKRPV